MFGKSFLTELANEVEGNLALNAISAVPVMTVNSQGQSVPTGALHTESGPFRYFGDGLTQLTSYNQLAQMIMLFKNFGAVSHGIKVYLPDTVYPAIVGTGLNQFAPERNNDIAMSWEVGEFGTPRVKYYQSNLLPIHYAGTLGEAGTVLTLVSTNDPTGQNVTQLTFSGAGTDADAVKAGDLFQFNDGVSGFRNMRYLTYIGHKVSANKVQMRATADAASSAGSVTISITPALNWAGGQNQNLNQALQAGMQVTILPSHKAGLVVGGDAFYIAMPQLPDQRPFDTANEYDPETGVSLRMTYGSILGANQKGIIYDETHGSLVVPIYSMRVIIPLTQA
ncbi:MAG: P22 phage major capsid protein family protein [Sulfuricurvum sp.]|nr:P22 phage major capsid protein family protein [Sulfuricurvum sp.]